MQSPEFMPWPTRDEGPVRLIGFADHELEKMLETAEGLVAAAIREVLILRAELHEKVGRS